LLCCGCRWCCFGAQKHRWLCCRCGKGPVDRVAVAGGVVKERSIAIGGVDATFGVAEKGERSDRSVLGANGVTQKCPGAAGGIFDSLERAWVSYVGKERPGADACVEVTFGVASEREKTNCRIKCAGGDV
jgi:hypothetical protein